VPARDSSRPEGRGHTPIMAHGESVAHSNGPMHATEPGDASSVRVSGAAPAARRSCRSVLFERGMTRMIRFACCIAAAFALLAAALPAASAQSPAPATESDYEPVIGMPGKDVVWVPTPPAVVE